jgi:glutamate dehydrogenase (NAD(P)+)
MAWMMDEYETMVGHHHPGVITGKPIPLGGSEGRGDATARGGIYVTREAAKQLSIDLPGKTMAIQGFGNAGQYAALLGNEILGLKLVAASDSKGGIYNAKGLDPKQVVEYKLKSGSLQGFPGAERISNEELLELDVTVLFPSALENVITGANADRIRCKISCELANGPTTPEADEILHQNKVFVLPDFLANAGGVTVSYFEQVQNAYNFYWPLEETSRLPRFCGPGGRSLQAEGLGIRHERDFIFVTLNLKGDIRRCLISPFLFCKKTGFIYDGVVKSLKRLLSVIPAPIFIGINSSRNPVFSCS